MQSTVRQFIAWFIGRIVARFHALITAGALVLSVLAIWVIAGHWNINSDLRALLPPDSEASRAMQEVQQRVGSDTALFVVISSPSTEKNKEFAGVFAEELREMDAVSLAHFHNDKRFFSKNRLLYVPQEDLTKLRERVAGEIREAKQKANPFFVSLDSDDEESTKDREAETSLDPEKLEQKYERAHDRYKEYLMSDDGYSLTIVVKFARSSSDLVATQNLLERVRKLGESLNPASYHADMEIDYGGGLVSRQKQYNSIVSDVKTSALLTLAGLFFVIAFYFRRLRAVALVLTPLIMGVLWTLALAFWFFGELTTVSVFIFAILLGLGIDFSIHLLSGYDEGRLEGLSAREALVQCYMGTGRATIIGATTTFMTFVVISFAEFKGLAQFGQIASLGVALTLVAMMTVLPSLVLTLQSLLPHTPKAGSKRLADRAFEALPHNWLSRAMPALLLASAALTGLAGWWAPEVRFQENFRKIGEFEWPWAGEEGRDQKDKLSPAERARKQARADGGDRAEYVRHTARRVRKAVDPDSYRPPKRQKTVQQKYSSALEGQYSSVPTVLLFDNPEEVEKVTRHMRQMRRDGKLDSIASLSSIYSFVPGTADEQQARLAELHKIEELLAREDLSVLDGTQRERVEKLRKHLDVKPVDIYDLPNWTKRLFREAGPDAVAARQGEDFAFEYMIYLVLRVDQMKGGPARAVVDQFEQIRRQTGADFEIASQAKVYVTMLDHIQQGGLRLISVALVLVALLLMITFGHPLRGLMALTPMLFGAFWLFGLIGWLGIHLDFFNVIIIPVIIGIGVDDGVHFYRHYMDAGRGAVPHTLRWIGAAVLMTSITSAIGFGGLATTQQDGLRSIGQLAISGIAMTFLATVLLLPALLALAERLEWDVFLPEEGPRD